LNDILSKDKLRDIYEHAAQSVTEKLMNIVLRPTGTHINADVYTVYTSFIRGISSGLAFCAERSLAIRMTRNMMHRELVESQDVEDYLKEYLNVLCGQIVGAVYKDTKVAARFHFPEFHEGRYKPENMTESWEVSFLSDQNEVAWLVHYKSLDDE